MGFLGKPIDQCDIGENVTNIGSSAFTNNPNLATVMSMAVTPPSLHANAFASRDQINVVVPRGAQGAYQDPANGWTGFGSITSGSITVGDIKYGFTSPGEVSVLDYTGTATGVTIPQTVNDQDIDYTVTAIGPGAFDNENSSDKLTSVTIPEGVTTIGTGLSWKTN